MDTGTRRAETGDWEQLWPLLQGMGTVVSEQESKRSYAALLADERWLIVLAEHGATIVGYAAAQDYGPHLRTLPGHGVARLHDIYVATGQRQRGIGRLLMDAVTDWAGRRVRYLQWQAHETRSTPFYERLGYRGEPCPQPDYPEFEIDFNPQAASL